MSHWKFKFCVVNITQVKFCKYNQEMYSKQNNVPCVVQGGAWSGDGLPRDSFRPDEAHKIRRSGDPSGKVMLPSSLYSTSSLRISFILEQNWDRHWNMLNWVDIESEIKSKQSLKQFRRSVTILSSDPGATMSQCRNKTKQFNLVHFCPKFHLSLNFHSTESFWLRLIKTTCSPSITSLCGTAWPWKTRLEASSTTPSTTKVGLLSSSTTLSFD